VPAEFQTGLAGEEWVTAARHGKTKETSRHLEKELQWNLP